MEDILFNQVSHKVVKITKEEEEENGGYVSSNQYLIVNNDDDGVLLDPGGRVMFTSILECVKNHIKPTNINYIFLSHQDPDVASSLQDWTQITSAKIVVSKWWARFISLFGVFDLGRIESIEDNGAKLTLQSGANLYILPAHFLHSPANLCVYDPISKILFSGDIGAAIFPYSEEYYEVQDFEKHKSYMQAFHQRYMGSSYALKLWVAMVRKLDIDIIAPQHGAYFPKQHVGAFLDWLDSLECGADLASAYYKDILID